MVCVLKVHPLLHEAGEGGEVALERRIDKSLLRLRAQPSALSASQELGGEARARGEASAGVHRVRVTVSGLATGLGMGMQRAQGRSPGFGGLTSIGVTSLQAP